MKIKSLIIAAALLIAGCGQQEAADDERKIDPLAALQAQLNELMLTANSLTAVVNSDFRDCTNSASYATDKLTNRICQIAQAATAEMQEEMQGQLMHYTQSLQAKIEAINVQMQSDAANLAAIQSSITTLQGDVLALDSRLDDAESDIAALEVLTNTLNGAIANAFAPVEVGTELLSAGPLYESVLRTTDKLLIHSFVIAESVGVVVNNNGLAMTAGSATITVNATTHGFLTGDLVRLDGLANQNNVTRADLQGEFVVTVTNANQFTVSISHTASNTNASFGGAAGTATKVIARGMSRVWQTADVADAAVRVAVGSRPYNFIIKKGLTGAGNANQGYVCYDQTNRQATFATINAATAVGLNGNVRCK